MDKKNGLRLRSWRPPGGNEGFTLSELLVVLAVWGMMTTGVVAAMAVLPEWRLRTSAQTVVTTLRAARIRALVNQVDAAVTFDTSRGRFNLVVPSTGSQAFLTELRAPVRFARPDGVETVTLIPPGTSELAALFDGRGLLRSDNAPGFVYLGDPQRGRYLRVGVNLVGVVTIQSWDGAIWK